MATATAALATPNAPWLKAMQENRTTATNTQAIDAILKLSRLLESRYGDFATARIDDQVTRPLFIWLNNRTPTPPNEIILSELSCLVRRYMVHTLHTPEMDAISAAKLIQPTN